MKEIAAGEWRDIPGYEGRYQASYEGGIRRTYGNGRTRELKPFHHKMRGSQRLVVNLSMDGRRQMKVVSGLVALAFFGPPPPGHVAWHKNGMQADNCAGNLEYVHIRELGRRTGASSRRRPVRKLDVSGEPVAFYSSAREAAKDNHMSYQTVLDRCNGKVKNPLALDGHDYAWDDMPEGRPGRKPRKDKEGTA